MKAVIQRVRSASVSIEGNEISSINQGLLILIGVEKDDSSEDLDYLVKKTVGLRIDEVIFYWKTIEKWNPEVKEIEGEIINKMIDLINI